MNVSAIAMETHPGQIDANMQTLENHLAHAARDNVDFCIFPELNISGTFQSREEVAQFTSQSPGILSGCRNLSQQYQVAFTSGWAIREGDDFYIVQFLFDNGQEVGRHYKTHLAGREAAIFSPANRIPVFRIRGTLVGMQLCLESHFPEIASIQASQGARIIAIGFASPRETPEEKLARFLRFLPARGYDNSCYIVAANQSGMSATGRPLAPVALITNPRGEIISRSIKKQTPATAAIEPAVIDRIQQSAMGWFNGLKRDFITLKPPPNQT